MPNLAITKIFDPPYSPSQRLSPTLSFFLSIPGDIDRLLFNHHSLVYTINQARVESANVQTAWLQIGGQSNLKLVRRVLRCTVLCTI